MFSMTLESFGKEPIQDYDLVHGVMLRLVNFGLIRQLVVSISVFLIAFD